MRKPPLLHSFGHAFRGIYKIWMSERNFRIETVGLLVNIILIFYFKIEASDAALLIAISLLVLSAEIFNTAIEKICDIIHPEYDERIKYIKDISSAGVSMVVFAALIASALIYLPYLHF